MTRAMDDLGQAQWLCITGLSESGNTVSHVIPQHDVREHEETAGCWCQPALDYEFMVATHNSADERERFEAGERKPS